MNVTHDIERIPTDLDRFLASFFDRRGWSSEIKYDPADNQLYLDVRLASGKLSADDRFLSLVEYFTRVQDAVLRKDSDIKLQCRLYGADGNELTTVLHMRGSSYLDDDRRESGMRRRLAWLSFRRRFLVRTVPGALLWTATYVLVVAVIGVPIDIAIMVSFGALLLQYGILFLLARKA
jgi:hypothetical protein